MLKIRRSLDHLVLSLTWESLFLGKWPRRHHDSLHPTWRYSDVIMGAMASQITRLTIVYATDYSGGDQRKYQSFASLDLRHRWPVNSQRKWPVTRKMFPFDDVFMNDTQCIVYRSSGMQWSWPLGWWPVYWIRTAINYGNVSCHSWVNIVW